MEFINQNLQVHVFKILSDLRSPINIESHVTDQNSADKLAFIMMDKLDMSERILLRKLVHDGVKHIVIVSNTPKIGLFAWKVGAFHFMDFPFTISQLKLLQSKIKNTVIRAQLMPKKIRVGYTGGFDLIRLDDIVLIIGQGNYCKIYSQNQISQTYTYRIGKFEEILKDQINFIKVTKSIVININHVAQISSNKVKFSGNVKVSLELSARATKVLKDELLWLNI